MKANVYAIRDRLLNYFMQPFLAPNDASALASISETVNEPGGQHAIQKSPHHFEVWRICEIDEDNNSTGKKEFLADASSLIRDDFRKERPPGGVRLPLAPSARTSPPGGPESGTTAGPGLPAEPAKGGDKSLRQTGQGPEGGPLPHSER